MKRVFGGMFTIKQLSKSNLGHFQYKTKSIFGHFQYQTIFKETFRDRMRPVKQQLCQVGLTDDLQLQIANCKWDDLQKHLQIEKKTRISNHNEESN